jgi:DNA-binding MarR family transcriptional regulator
VRRTTTPNDGRARIVQLTASGKRMIEDAFQRHSADIADVMGILRSGEQAELVRLLKKLGLWAAARAEK